MSRIAERVGRDAQAPFADLVTELTSREVQGTVVPHERALSARLGLAASAVVLLSRTDGVSRQRSA